MSSAAPRHRGEEPEGPTHFTGEWHVGRYWIGMFPAMESHCPCPKAPCGLAMPVVGTFCPHHHGQETLRQVHHQDDCVTYWRKGRKGKRG